MLSARLFILYLDKYIERMKAMNAVIPMSELVVNYLLYPGDAIFLGSSPPELKTLYWKNYCKNKRLQLSTNKTKVLVSNKEATRMDVGVLVDNVVLE